MRVLTATTETQGDRAGDFAWCDPGELVTRGTCCDSPSCGCDRAFTGLDTGKGTTTAAVTDRPGMQLAGLARALVSSWQAAGLVPPGGTEAAAREAALEAAGMDRIARAYRPGTILDLRDGRPRLRRHATA